MSSRVAHIPKWVRELVIAIRKSIISLLERDRGGSRVVRMIDLVGLVRALRHSGRVAGIPLRVVLRVGVDIQVGRNVVAFLMLVRLQ